MKKTLLAAALLAGFAGAASAQSSVTLYGILDAGLVYKNFSGVATNPSTGAQTDYSQSSTGLGYGTQSGNRLGFKGVEDMGSGNRLTFQIENGFTLGDGTLGQGGRLFGRQSWFGVENDAWGFVRIGRQLNGATDFFGDIDPFAQGFAQANLGTVMGSMNTMRMDNALKYQTPNLSGFVANISYSFATGYAAVYTPGNGGSATAPFTSTTGYNYDTTNNTRQLSLAAKYANGPLLIAASADVIYGSAALATTPANITEYNLGATYDFKVVKIAAGYAQTNNGWMAGQQNQGNSGSNLFGATTTVGAFGSGGLFFNENMKVNSYMLGFTAPIGATSKVFGSWLRAQGAGDTIAANSAIGITAAAMNVYSIGYQYDFTKRTNLYAYASQVQNYAMVDQLKSTVLGVGMRHQF